MHARKPVVLLVSGEYPPYTSWGGNAYQLASLAKLLNREGYDVEIIAESDNGEEFIHLDEGGNLVHRINGGRSYLLRTAKKLLGRWGKRFSLRDLGFACRVAERAFELTTVWNREILWVETTNWRAETALFHLLPSLNARTVIRTVTPMEEVVRQNGVNRKDVETRAALLQERFQQYVLKHRLYSNPEYRSYFEERVQTKFASRPPAEEQIFLLPFDFSRVPARHLHKRKSGTGPLRILTVGRIEPRKGFDVLCSALSGLSPAQRAKLQIVAVGRDVPMGPLESYQQLLLAKYPGIADACIEFVGAVSDEKLKELYAGADIGLVASTSESFGYNLLETLAAELPVITSEVGAANEFERRGVKYLGKFKTTAELTRILADLPERFEDYHVGSPRNRPLLDSVYAENDGAYLRWIREHVARPHGSRQRKQYPNVHNVDVIICSYNRFEELMLSLGTVLREAEATTAAGTEAKVTVVYQNEGVPEKVYAIRPDLRGNDRLSFVFSSVPSLTRARNTGLHHTSADLVLYVDDDVILEPGFISEHVKAANANPSAIGVVGRIRSRLERQRTSTARAVGQIKATGFIEANFESIEAKSTLVPQSPMGTNMAYRRDAMNALFGDSWFDERFTGSAFREESTLAVEIFRRGENFVYAPDAVLYHYESISGGCENRNTGRTLQQLIHHFSLDYLYLNHLYAPSDWMRAVAPLNFLVRDLQPGESLKSRVRRLYVHARGYAAARKLFSRKPPLRIVSPRRAGTSGAAGGAQSESKAS